MAYYAVMELGKMRFSTEVSPETGSPTWNEQCTLCVRAHAADACHRAKGHAGRQRRLPTCAARCSKIKDRDKPIPQLLITVRSKGGREEFVGRVSIPLNEIPFQPASQRWVKMRNKVWALRLLNSIIVPLCSGISVIRDTPPATAKPRRWAARERAQLRLLRIEVRKCVSIRCQGHQARCASRHRAILCDRSCRNRRSGSVGAPVNGYHCGKRAFGSDDDSHRRGGSETADTGATNDSSEDGWDQARYRVAGACCIEPRGSTARLRYRRSSAGTVAESTR